MTHASISRPPANGVMSDPQLITHSAVCHAGLNHCECNLAQGLIAMDTRRAVGCPHLTLALIAFTSEHSPHLQPQFS
jgi:hypothetical protein